MLPDLSQPDAPSFSAPELARRFDGGEVCAVQRCSVRDAGWSSVLIRVARRNDSSGYAGLGVLRHPRIMLVTRGSELYAQSAAAFLLAHLLSNYGTGAPGPLPMGREDARVRTAIEFMRARLSLPVSLADIAASAGLSPYHFLRVFGSVTGVPPFRFLTRMRIDAARRQLQEGNLSVTEIAALCGFSSASQFSTAFRRETGMAPSEFRRAAAS